MAHQAIEMAEPGDVIEVDAGGALENAIIRDSEAPRARGCELP